MRTEGYSLWIMPDGKIRDRLAGIISRLSVKYDGPFFEPHITVAGSVRESEEKVVNKVKELASSVKPFSVKLGSVGTEDNYFRSFFVRVQENREIMDLNRTAGKILGVNGKEYKPHLSLFYGDVPVQLKEEMMTQTGRELNIEFDVRSIHLFRTEGEAGDWKRVGVFPLG